jgi:hypothetical protein
LILEPCKTKTKQKLNEIKTKHQKQNKTKQKQNEIKTKHQKQNNKNKNKATNLKKVYFGED